MLLLSLALLGGCIPQMEQADPRYGPPPIRYEPPRADDGFRSTPAQLPAWQVRPVSPDAQTIRASSYVVRPGDTLRAIADRTGSGSEAIARANGLVPPFIVQPGQRLQIPAGRYHLVRAGETGIAIARAYGVDWSRIISINALTAPYTLRVGMRVLIPGGPVSIEERAAAFRLDVDDIVTGGEPALATNQRPTRPSSSPTRILPPSAALAEPARLKGAFAWPLRGSVIARFGPGASGERYNGIKIAAPIGTPVLAAADGVVAYAGTEVANLGGLVILKHGDGWTTVYGHASQLLVQRGQAVKKGQTIAISGDSGLADRPELHFEMRKGRTPVDPLGQLPSR
uniref:M23 family metallopeptidase n=1 Tax=Sphingomonas bacterium TaxID=1895847 RepID=UPI002617129C|nr:M23 family metallopeptidase [Sphingomonas bacterium]